LAQTVHFQDDEIARYSRHILLPEVGGPGLQRLKHSSALVVGAGGGSVRQFSYILLRQVMRLNSQIFNVKSFTARLMSAGLRSRAPPTCLVASIHGLRFNHTLFAWHSTTSTRS
jgi:hypothetical protein